MKKTVSNLIIVTILMIVTIVTQFVSSIGALMYYIFDMHRFECMDNKNRPGEWQFFIFGSELTSKGLGLILRIYFLDYWEILLMGVVVLTSIVGIIIFL